MRIVVNGDWRETDAANLAAVLQELGYGDAVVATALNSKFVSADARSKARLADGDQVEVLAPMQGG